MIAELVFALYPPLIFYTVELTTEGLFLVLLIAALFVFYRTGGELSSARVFCLGVLTGLAALCRPNGLMLIPAIGSFADVPDRAKMGANGPPNDRAHPRRGDHHSSVDISQLPALSQICFDQHEWRSEPVVWSHFRLDPGATMAEIGYFSTRHSARPEPEREK